MTRRTVRSQPCSRDDAKVRLAQARKFLEVAELVATEDAVPESASVAASLAVLAGIAAADAACCAALGSRSRGQDHREALALVATVAPGGGEAERNLRRLLDLKDTAQYGLINIGGQKLKTALRHAAHLVEFAQSVLAR